MPTYVAAPSGTVVRRSDGTIQYVGGGAPLPGDVTGAQLAELVANGRVTDSTDAAIDPTPTPATPGTGLTEALATATYAAVVSALPSFGDDSTDATTHLQATIDAANTAGAAIYVPNGVYRVSAPLENVRRMTLAPGARIVASTPGMAAVVRTQTATRWDNGWINGKGTIDAGTNADIAVHLRNFLYFEVSGVQLLGGNDAALKLGSSGAAGRSAEAIVSNVRIYNAGNVVADSRGILVENSGDHSISQVLIQNYDVGVTLPAAGNAILHDVHVWTEPAKGSTRIGFEDTANNSHYAGCHADTVTEYGWRLYGYQTTLVQCGTYNNPTAANATDNVVVGVKLEAANAIATIVGHYFFGGSGAKRLAADIEAADGNYGLVQTLGCSNQHVATVRALYNRSIGTVVRDSVTAGQGFRADSTTPLADLGLSIRTNGLDRWKFVSDGVAESGSNAGSGLLLRRYDDAGVVLGNVFYVARTGTFVMYSNVLMGPSASIIPDGTNGLKIGTATTQKLGFWNSTPIVQPQTSGVVAGHTAGAGTAVTHDSTFTGNFGTKAYTISDIISNLKQAGILKTNT